VGSVHFNQLVVGLVKHNLDVIDTIDMRLDLGKESIKVLPQGRGQRDINSDAQHLPRLKSLLRIYVLGVE
jgi:hypothetical protein